MPKNVQSTPFAKLKMILQKLDNFHKLFSHNKSGGLWLSGTVVEWMLTRCSGHSVGTSTLRLKSG